MGLRPGRIYRDVPGQPYTRMSQKSDNDNYISGAPAPKITIFETGDKTGEYDSHIVLKVDEECCIRSNALESARVAANSYLSRNLTMEDYHLKVKPYPHHVLRHHPLAGVAQADRYYEGMRKPFGRPIGRGAIVDEDQEILLVRVDSSDTDVARKAADRAGMKIPVNFRVHRKDQD
ncbi:MAG: 50S ribosomal protein L16 [Candidatus Nanohaloarchaeota archaeon QJJ-5]|nr:50S ribosomal protein L16 [Candidatus Nanohaloarchaeota archaeon QJJ-5]